MQFSSFSEFIDMGGYGFYVWLSFGAAALILTLLTLVSVKGHNKVLTQIAKRMAREDKLRQARAAKTKHHIENNEVEQ